MIRRLLCALGLHRWVYDYQRAGLPSRRCLCCDRRPQVKVRGKWIGAA